ncbi:MAG: hypothetical protein KGJ57_17565 [Sphingomonadales bacterium]|nr:hypothetical protein [Sphingomonadales bacterium]MDE2171207.1 hypothetical protein [Sphingomonadales bacterium]
MSAGLIPADPTAESIEEIVACAERRVVRAAVRLERAQREHDEAVTALRFARENRRAWKAAHPDDQFEMFDPLPALSAS